MNLYFTREKGVTQRGASLSKAAQVVSDSDPISDSKPNVLHTT
jgi:hypothetical protein